MRLAGADHRPLDVAHRLPPAQPARVGPDAARGLVGGQERLQLAQPGDRQLVVAEAPGADHQPGEVLGRVAGVAELPVDHRGEPALVDDQVAEPEVAVDERSRPGAAPAGAGAATAARPRPPAAARRSRRAPPPTARRPRAPARRRRRRAPRPPRPRPSGSARAPRRAAPAGARAPPPARRAAARAAPPRSRRRTPSGSRLPLRAARPQARRRPSERPRTPARSAASIARSSSSSGANDIPARGLAAEHEPRLAGGRDQERLPRRPALDRAQLDRARVGADLGEHLADRRRVRRLSPRGRHRRRARARGA